MRLLRAYKVALVIAETARRWPMMQDVTASFLYMRLHDDTELYKSGYGEKALDRWARRIKDLASRSGTARCGQSFAGEAADSRPGDVYVFFDNTDVKLRAPFDALGVKYRPSNDKKQ